jgi:hypothetical protein
VSVKPTRPLLPRGAPRTPLPMLETLLDRQGKTKSWLTAALGYEGRQAWHNNEKAGGWPDVDVPRIAALLGVSHALLTATGAEQVPDAAPTVRLLLAQPELARLVDDVSASMRRQLDTAITDAVSATVALLAAGAVPMPVGAAGRRRGLTPADVRELESKTAARPVLARRGQVKRG